MEINIVWVVFILNDQSCLHSYVTSTFIFESTQELRFQRKN